MIDGTGARELDADGALVTPGFVDIHCHYDGPATWDERLQPCGQRPGRLTVAGAASAVAGLGLVLELMGNTEVAAVGVLWGLGAAVGLATYFVVAETEEALPPLVVAWGGLVNRGGIVLAVAGVVGVLGGITVVRGRRAAFRKPGTGAHAGGARRHRAVCSCVTLRRADREETLRVGETPRRTP